MEVTRIRKIMGEDYWRYGLDPADPTLKTFLGYMHAQGLSSRAWRPEDLFAPEAADAVIV
jgi:4,5-dihydroxyphthalate decarboxylase